MTRDLTVLHVEAGQRFYGGAVQVSLLLAGLEARGVANVLVCPPGAAIAAAAAASAQVHQVPMRGDLDLSFVVRLRRVIRACQPDLVHLHSRRGADLLGAVAARLEGLPAVLSRRVDNPEPRWLVRHKYRLYGRVIAISQAIRTLLLSQGVPAEQVVCVPSAVAYERFATACDPAWLAGALGVPARAPLIGMVAQFIERKGHRVLLAAAPAILRRHPQARFLLLGQGPLWGPMRRRAAELGVVDKLVFAGFRDDIEALLPCLNVLVHPASREGLGVAVLQAAAAGVPVVGANAGGIPEAIDDGITGFLIPPGDSAALADGVCRLLDDPERAREMGAAGRHKVAREFSVEAMVSANLRVYRELLGA